MLAFGIGLLAIQLCLSCQGWLSQTLLDVQGCTIVFNTFRQIFTYVLYTYMPWTIPDMTDWTFLEPSHVSSRTALNDLYHSNLTFRVFPVVVCWPPCWVLKTRNWGRQTETLCNLLDILYSMLGFLWYMCSFFVFVYKTWAFFRGPKQHWMTCFIQTQHLSSYCLLTPLLSPKDTKCKLIDKPG